MTADPHADLYGQPRVHATRTREIRPTLRLRHIGDTAYVRLDDVVALLTLNRVLPDTTRILTERTSR